MQSDISDPESLKVIVENENERFSLGRKGKDIYTERLIKPNNNNDVIFLISFKKQVEFFETINKEKNLPRMIPIFLDWQIKTNYIMHFEEVSMPFIEHLEKFRLQKKIIPFSEVLMYFNVLLNGFCFMQLEGFETNQISIKDLFLTKKNDLKLLNYYNEEKKNDNRNFLGILLTILNLNLDLELAKLTKDELLKEIENVEINYKGYIYEKEKEIYDKIIKCLKNEDNKKLDLFKLFTKTINTQNKTNLKKMILLKDGIYFIFF